MTAMWDRLALAFDREFPPENHAGKIDWQALRAADVFEEAKHPRGSLHPDEDDEDDEDKDECEVAEDSLAFDRDTSRSYDDDGRLHVADANISKATVNPYFGREIPGWQALGLNADQPYRMFRDPDELAKAASSFNKLPLLSRHVHAHAGDHKPDLVIGATGSDAAFRAPYLTNSLVVWAASDIAKIEGNLKRQISCSYRYRPDMTPGAYGGQTYDGVMRDIRGSHVALVELGRAGPDVLIGDSAPEAQKEQIIMTNAAISRKALMVQSASIGFLAGKLAADAKPDLAPIFAGLTAANFKESKPALVAGLTAATKGKLASDSALAGYATFLGAFDDVDPEEKDDDKKKAEDETDAECEARKAREAKDKKAKDEESDEEKKKKEKEDEAEAKDRKTAMDAAISAALKPAIDAAVKRERDAARDLMQAKETVEGAFGKLRAFDSAEDYYRAALTSMEVKGADKLDASVLKPMVESLIDARSRVSARPRAPAAADSAAKGPSFPNADRLRRTA